MQSNTIIESPPEELNNITVLKWSEHYKRLDGIESGKAIQTKARKFLKEGCIEYDPTGEKYNKLGDYDGHKFICKPIKGYNSTTYRIWQDKATKEFKCSCQFHQKTGMQCSHITALWLQLKIWNWKRNHGSS